MSSSSKYHAPTPEQISEFCEALREKMTEAAEHTTLTVEASFGHHEIAQPHPDGPEREADGSWVVRIYAGARR